MRDPAVTARIRHLQSLIKLLSTTASPKTPLLPVNRILSIITQAELSSSCTTCSQVFSEEAGTDGAHEKPESSYEHELEWLLLSKATVQAYGQILDTILQQTILLNNDIWYWDDILGSYRFTGLYSIQTSPLRFWAWSKTIYRDVRERGGSVSDGWKQFYGLVRDVVRERSILDLQRRVISPLARVRQEAKKKQAALKRTKHVNANALGVLLGESLSNESIHDEGLTGQLNGVTTLESRHKWKSAVAKSIAFMDAVLQNVNEPDVTTDNFNNYIATITQEDPYYESYDAVAGFGSLALKPAAVAARLHVLLKERMPEYTQSIKAMAQGNGRPPWMVRYWLPLSLLLVSSTTLYRVVKSRRAEIITWIREFGVTIMDFWSNWVLEPAKKVIATIRHDEGSEVSIMSKRSLEGDRASLERMVVDFAISHPDGAPLNDSDIAGIRAKVKEGDLTPVLKAYEKDMQRPFLGTIRGNLIQALLIQVQKTKVDVEVAMSGIDSILKSQELLFGFIGLTPGVLVVIGTWRWLNGTFNNREGLRRGSRKDELVRILR